MIQQAKVETQDLQPFISVEDNEIVVASKRTELEKIWNKYLGFIVACVIGVYTGYRCTHIDDSYIYALLFFGEGLTCLIISKILKNYSLSRLLKSFYKYFIVSGITTPIFYLLFFNY